MPPEQTRGAKDVDARADIYSLGAALYHGLAGRTPFDAASLAELLYKVQRVDPSPPSGFNAEVDADLDTIALKCLQKDPKDRYQNAGELAEDLKRWLAGDQPVGGPEYLRARALALAARVLYPKDDGVKALLARICLSQAKRARAQYEEAKAKTEALEAKEEEAQVAEPPKDDAERRGHPEAERALAKLYWDEYLRAEKARDRAEEKRCEALVVRFGHEEYAARVRGERDVKVEFRLLDGPEGKEVVAHLFCYELCQKPPILIPVPCDPRDGRLLVEVSALAPSREAWTPVPLLEAAALAATGTPSRTETVRWGSVYRLDTLPENRVALSVDSGRARLALRLPKGSYLLFIPSGQGLYETRYPFEVARDYAWDEACDLVGLKSPPLPPGISAPDPSQYWVYTPPGPYRASGDRDAQQSPPRPAAVIRVPEGKRLADLEADRNPTGAWMARFEVTCGMYLEYLNDREWHKQCKPWDHVPRKASDAMEQTAYWSREASTGRFSVSTGWAEWPILAVSWNDATDYCKWLTARRGGTDWRFELPTEDEWERAARDPYGRFFPWGDSFDAAFCRMQDSRPDTKDLNPERFGLFPLDEGPSGLRDLAGGMREMTSTIAGARGHTRPSIRTVLALRSVTRRWARGRRGFLPWPHSVLPRSRVGTSARTT